MSDIDIANLTWTCMVCGDERPDAAISVAHRPVKGMEAQFPNCRMNVRYCNDRVSCVGAAHGPVPWENARGRRR